MELTHSIQNRIYEVRGERIILDMDLAELYSVETRSLNQVVKRNLSRFPADFMFQLTKDEWTIVAVKRVNLKSQSVISSHHGGRRTLPYVFTEQGAAS